MPLDQYLQMFARLRRAPGPVWTEATLKRAPHKPILLLAVIDLVSRGDIQVSDWLKGADDLDGLRQSAEGRMREERLLDTLWTFFERGMFKLRA